MPVDLIVDCYRDHLAEGLMKKSTQAKIRLDFTPVGLMDKLQRLNRSVFECLKALARAEYQDFFIAYLGEVIRVPNAVTMRSSSWNHFLLVGMEARFSISDDSECHHPDGESDDCQPVLPSRAMNQSTAQGK
jgi:hypothetical protein